ncbi:PRC-barrel domain containing protein [Streptomyces sp. H10-C2]|uniref:PRC-barrel domain-containing protein n=1 Tax=unclassified Streptomyces TaxID=2593676 RepID=UPI0024B96F48|nr:MULTISPECIES: PRC-barrel domain containing protein [unclassified Streptomyces]MDJ0347044.1 PRC-barrel domain containing protein [Streptomyces sp. PH10-H1]MDJ0375312.1 PRC-barrel domain containing protein [Streptomyces sp. H10-C2]
MSDSIWGYGPSSGWQAGTDLTGYKVEATDGSIGKVDKHSEEVGSAYLVVDTGVWIFGKHVLLPAGTIAAVDREAATIYVARTKDQIKNAPEFDKDKHTTDPGYHQQVGDYYTAQPHI